MTEPVPNDVAPAVRSSVLCAPWASPADVPERYRDREANEKWVQYLLWASEILWGLSGRRWYGSGCTETATFRQACGCCGQRVDHGDGTWWIVPQPSLTGWRTGHSPGLKLPRAPVASVQSVTVGGSAFTSYWIDHAAGILYRDDTCTWADCCTDDIVVHYTYGESPPEGGVRACVALGVQLALSDWNDSECVLPERVQSITREGISMAMLDPMDFLPQGHTGIYLVDLWLSTVNPKGRLQRAQVWSPDGSRARR